MKKKPAKKSPLEQLAEIAKNQALPVKVKPKNRLKKEAITPIIEDPQIYDVIELDNLPEGATLPMPEQIVIANSSLNLNFHLNVDDKAVDKIVEGSKQAFKGIAAAGATLLGTAFLLGGSNSKTPAKVKIPLMPKIKLPKSNKTE